MININSDNPLVVQSDGSLLLDVHNPKFEKAREDIAPFAELEKSPEHFHTYKINSISLWNAASAGLTSDEICKNINQWSKYPVPDNIIYNINDTISRFGKITLEEAEEDNFLLLNISDELIKKEIEANKKISKYLIPFEDSFKIHLYNRGTIKIELIKIGYPVDDKAVLNPGDPIEFSFREKTLELSLQY